MMGEEIEGWRVGLKSETQVGMESQTLEISGPGRLKIEIQLFKTSEVIVEGFANLEMAPPKFFELSCMFYDSVNKCNVSLDYLFHRRTRGVSDRGMRSLGDTVQVCTETRACFLAGRCYS